MPWREPDDIFEGFEDIKYQWKCKGENCAFCNIMEGRVYTLDIYMSSTVYPGFHQNCDCYLSPVPAETEMSDLDIFGSALNMRNNAWIEAFFGVKSDFWMPGYLALPQELLAFAKPGMTARQVMAAFMASESKRFGMFANMGFPFNLHTGWNVWANANKANFRSHFTNVKWDLYVSNKNLYTVDYMGYTLSGKAGLIPYPDKLKPISPSQTYHNKNYSSR